MQPLRVNFIRGCRGGLYIRPGQVRCVRVDVGIDPYGVEGDGGSDPLRHGFAMPPPLGHQGEAIFRFRGGG